MKTFFQLLIFILLATSLPAQTVGTFIASMTKEDLLNTPAKLIPYPKSIVWEKEFLEVKKVRLAEVPPVLLDELEGILAFHQINTATNSGLPIIFRKNNLLEEEAYRLKVSQLQIEVEAADGAGYFYALQTLRQLIQNKKGQKLIPICEIIDAPAFPVRGYMVDVGRNFQSLAALKEQLDVMAMYKLNVFHWHLTDRPAWRIESKKYPELTAAENHRPTRDPGMYYTYDEIREIIRYARARHISIIPEIDMPGHSDSFVKSMGVKMESEKGMQILENVLHEFFTEIPQADCPIIHIGSDEVKIKNPDEFISKMVRICENNGRKVVIWNPGLKANNKVIRQTWQTKHLEKAAFQEIDSWNNYINNGEPMTQIQRLFFKPIGYPSDNEVIGGILCFWPDVNVEKEEDALSQNPVFPSILTYAWKSWTADVVQAPEKFYMTLPPKGSEALDYFAAFEKILLHHKNTFFQNKPFPYFSQSEKYWKLIGPFQGDEGDAVLKTIKNSYLYQKQKLSWKEAVGNTLVIKDRFKLGGYYPNAQKGETAYALTYIHSDKSRTVETLVGFETPMRSNRVYTGIPAKGKWDANGGAIWINDEPLPAPEWQNAGWKPSKSSGWGSSKDQETPWGDEELYWTRNPVEVPLKKGWNKVLVKIPGSSDYQNWMFTFIPLDMNGLEFSSSPNRHSTYYFQKTAHFESLPNHKNEIIFIGDSITDGCEWSEVFDNKRVKNRGISGDVTQGVLDRLGEITESMPEKVFLMIGINDLAVGKSTDEIIENISQIVQNINFASPKTKVFVQSILPVNEYYGLFNRHTDKGNEISLINHSLAEGVKGNYQYIDLHSYFLNEDKKLDISLSNDGLHLNGKGYQLWASLIKKHVLK